MEILLFNDKGLSKLWNFKNVDAPFDKDGSTLRENIWEQYTETCRKEAGTRFGKFTLVISIRSRTKASDIDDQEFKDWDAMISNKNKEKTK